MCYLYAHFSSIVLGVGSWEKSLAKYTVQANSEIQYWRMAVIHPVCCPASRSGQCGAHSALVDSLGGWRRQAVKEGGEVHFPRSLQLPEPQLLSLGATAELVCSICPAELFMFKAGKQFPPGKRQRWKLNGIGTRCSCSSLQWSKWSTGRFWGRCRKVKQIFAI